MRQVSFAAPLEPAAHGLYLRMWQTAGFPELTELTEASHHHEALQKATIDDHEQLVRRKLAVADRRLGDITCSGRHHGETVSCAYATAQLAFDV